jgi:magnesium chelatase subunit I
MEPVNQQLISLMPYSMVKGQGQLKLALELAYIAPRIGGVLLSGQRGTGKSTVVRAFANAVYGHLPITLPINATEDRVVGGWNVRALLNRELIPEPGVVELADGKLLYIDEVNLLDDHIVNIILDVTSTGVLAIEREGINEEKSIRFTLVGTMNPSEGGLRPQLLDRFGLMVDVVSETDDKIREEILQAVLDYDAARAMESSGRTGAVLETLMAARKEDAKHGVALREARERFEGVSLSKKMAQACVRVGKRFQVEGHRGDYVMAVAGRARAALRGDNTVTQDDLLAVAPLALQHRRPGAQQSGQALWNSRDTEELDALLKSDKS